jgi:hypothetical protein
MYFIKKLYKVGQSVAIARYVAKVAGIAGKNEIDQALADGLVDFVTDFLNGESLIRGDIEH